MTMRACRHSLAAPLRPSAQAVGNIFFDYNTVESVLLFCAILVCLAGVLFNSGGLEEARDRELVTWVLVLVVFFSLVYFVMVVRRLFCLLPLLVSLPGSRHWFCACVSCMFPFPVCRGNVRDFAPATGGGH